MSTPVAYIYADVCAAVLESTGLTYTYSQTNFLSDLLVATRTLLQESALIQNVFTVNGTSGVGRYSVPDAVGEVLAVFWNNNYLYPATGMALNQDDPRWESESRTPEVWNMDLLAPDTIQISPTPAVNGTIIIVGTEQPTVGSLASVDTIPLVPDSLAHYLMFACLQKIWETEGEGKDVNRAKYCRARLEEMRNILRAVTDEEYREVL